MAGTSCRSNHSRLARHSGSSNITRRAWGSERPIVEATVSRRRAAASGAPERRASIRSSRPPTLIPPPAASTRSDATREQPSGGLHCSQENEWSWRLEEKALASTRASRPAKSNLSMVDSRQQAIARAGSEAIRSSINSPMRPVTLWLEGRLRALKIAANRATATAAATIVGVGPSRRRRMAAASANIGIASAPAVHSRTLMRYSWVGAPPTATVQGTPNTALTPERWMLSGRRPSTLVLRSRAGCCQATCKTPPVAARGTQPPCIAGERWNA